MLERERSAESVTKQYTETVRPMAYEHVWPTANMADLILPGHQPIAESMRALLAWLPIDLPFAMAAGKG